MIKGRSNLFVIVFLLALQAGLPVLANDRANKLNDEGVAAMKKGQFKRAMEKFEGALRIDEQCPGAAENLIAGCNQGTGKLSFEEQLRYRHLALKYSPRDKANIENIIRLGDVFRVRDQNAEAISEYRLALTTAEDSIKGETGIKLGAALIATGDIKSGLDAFEKALSYRPISKDVKEALHENLEGLLLQDPGNKQAQDILAKVKNLTDPAP